MKNESINPQAILQPISMYSNGLLSKPGRLLSIAGQCGLKHANEWLPFEEQARNCWLAIKAIVEEAGGSLEDIVSTNVYYRDATDEHRRTHSRVRQEFISKPYPASTAIGGVQLMIPGMEIEIQAFAVISAAER